MTGDQEARRNEAADDQPPEWLSDTPDSDPPESSLLRELADDPDSGLVELAAGVWYMSKLRPDRDELS